jgi:signal transduction histidine kinase
MSKLTDKELIQELENRFIENEKALSELQKITEELKEVNVKLEESEAIKTHFLSHIRNEIINPLSSIIGISKNISQLPKDKLYKIINFSEIIHNEAFELDQQLRNIFAAAEIEAGDTNPDFSFINIEELINEEIENYQSKLIEKKLKIELKFENFTAQNNRQLSDESKLRIIFSNVLRNAIKFSKEYSRIIIKIGISDSEINILIQDFGIGISKENISIIFDRFKKLDNSINSINRGHGLGLSIALAYVNLLNGTIKVESEIEKGAAFTITLPIIQKENLEGTNVILDEFLFDDETEEIF